MHEISNIHLGYDIELWSSRFQLEMSTGAVTKINEIRDSVEITSDNHHHSLLYKW